MPGAKPQQQVNGKGKGRRSATFPEVYLKGTAKAAGISISYLSKIFNGKSTPSLKTAVKLAGVMEMSVEELLENLDEAKIKREQLDSNRSKKLAKSKSRSKPRSKRK